MTKYCSYKAAIYEQLTVIMLYNAAYQKDIVTISVK